MLHKLFESGDWFAPKRYGYGAGLPIKWQGWVLIASFIGVIVGLTQLQQDLAGREGWLPEVMMLAALVLFILIAARKTRGGWRWRWGERD